MSKKSIVILTCPWVPNPKDAMAGLFLLRYAEALYIAGYDPILAAPIAGDGNQLIKYEQDFTPIRLLPYTGGRIQKYAAWKKVIQLCIQEFGKPIAIWHHVADWNLLPVFNLCKEFKFPLYLTEHWSRWLPESPQSIGFLEIRVLQYILPKLAGVSAVSKILAEAIETKIQIEIPHITPVPLTEDFFNAPEFPIPYKKPYVLHISCFDDSAKRIRLLIKQFLASKSTAIDLVLIGTGKDYKSIQQEFKKFPNIIFLGEIKNRQILQEYIQHAIALVQTSAYETYSMVVTEALILGTPVVSTPVGVWKTIQNENLGRTIDFQFKSRELLQSIKQCKRLNRDEIQSFAKQYFNLDVQRLRIQQFLWIK